MLWFADHENKNKAGKLGVGNVLVSLDLNGCDRHWEAATLGKTNDVGWRTQTGTNSTTSSIKLTSDQAKNISEMELSKSEGQAWFSTSMSNLARVKT